MIRILLAAAISVAGMTAQADEPLPDAVVNKGDGQIIRTWLADPTDRYGHAILGDAIEAGALKAELRDGTVLTYRLPETSVFEDREARLADLNGDGADELVVVESNLSEGAALAVFGLRDGRIEPVARDRWIGTRNRWLNPAGIADFDGDGTPEVAIVVTPHIGGTLKFLRLDGSRLLNVAEMWGFSNHAIGSRDQHLSVVVDWDGDGVMDIVLPDEGRRTIRVIGLASGKLRELADYPLPSGVAGNFELRPGPVVRVPLRDGSVAEIRPSDG